PNRIVARAPSRLLERLARRATPRVDIGAMDDDGAPERSTELANELLVRIALGAAQPVIDVTDPQASRRSRPHEPVEEEEKRGRVATARAGDQDARGAAEEPARRDL